MNTNKLTNLINEAGWASDALVMVRDRDTNQIFSIKAVVPEAHGAHGTTHGGSATIWVEVELY